MDRLVLKMPVRSKTRRGELGPIGKWSPKARISGGKAAVPLPTRYGERVPPVRLDTAKRLQPITSHSGIRAAGAASAVALGSEYLWE
jgi:hypothetical protein